MEDFLYAYNQPKKFGKYDLILDGKIIANEVVYKVLTEDNDIENINLADKLKELESKSQNSFTFETVTELPTEGKESVIYLVPNGDTSDDENSYYEYLWDKTNSKFELIGSGSYGLQKAELDKEIKDRTDADTLIRETVTSITGYPFEKITGDTLSISDELAKRVPYTLYKDVNVAGNVKDVVKLDVPESSDEAMYCPQGLIMGGTAQEAGLVTRGICGIHMGNTNVSTTTNDGSCIKENLYINYDGDNTYKNGRHLILQAVESGEHYGHNLYQYAAARGDAVKGYVDEKIENRVVINDPITITEGDNTTSITSDTISTTTLTGTLDAESMKNSLTAEAIQNVAPISWSSPCNKAYTNPNQSSIAIGSNSYASNYYAYSFGAFATAGQGSVALGYNPETKNHCVSIGYKAKAKSQNLGITIGAEFTETADSGNIEHYCKTEGTGSITIGAGANTLNNGDIESSNSVTIGCKAENKLADSVVIGASATGSASAPCVVLGAGSKGSGKGYCVAIGTLSEARDNDIAIGHNSIIQGGQSIGIGYNTKNNAASYTTILGAQAAITNTTAEDGTVIKSENTTVIGYGAKASSPNAVVMGAGASNSGQNSVVIGVGAKAVDSLATIIGCNATATTNASAMGYRANASFHSIAIGHYAQAKSVGGIAIGNNSNADKHALSIGSSAQSTSHNAIAIGTNAKANDIGATVIRSTAEDNTITQLYFSGANTPLALKYYPTEWEKKQDVDEQGNPKVDDEGNPVMIDDMDKPTKGQAMMGYVVSKVITNDEGEQETKVLECGTNLLAALFPNHGLGDNPFQPTTTAIDGEEIMSFHPSDLDLPIEEPSDNNDVEINIPSIETPIEEEYKPLPIYPIVEPTINEITE